MGLSTIQKKMSGFLVTGLIALIIVSFLFQSYESRRGGVDTIAKVGGQPITVSEYQSAYQYHIQMYSKFMGGKELSTAQVETFGIKKQVMSALISKALMINLGKELGYNPAKTEIAKTIKEMPMFKNGEQFDFERYKAILLQNGYTPTNYETVVGSELLQTGVESLVKSFPLSEAYINDVKKFKERKANATVITFTADQLKNSIKISDDEIKKFLNDKNNETKANNLFIDRKQEFTRAESVKVKHILIRTSKDTSEEQALKKINELHKKLTPQNFAALAKQYTEDPSGKSNGGDLPLFSKGTMAKEFEEKAFAMEKGTISSPIKTSFGHHIIYKENHVPAVGPTFEQFKTVVVTDYLRNEKKGELGELAKSVLSEIENLMRDGKIDKVELLKNKYSLNIAKDQPVNMLDGINGVKDISSKDLKDLFDLSGGKNNVKSSASESTFAVVKLSPAKDKKSETEKSYEKEGQELVMAKQVRGDILEKLKTSFAIKDYGVI